MLVNVLKQLGPCLSTDLSEHLVKNYRLSPVAARQRISRAPPEVKRLAHLPFLRKARFLYLQNDYASPRYWESLFHGFFSTNGAYARALGAVHARGIMPLDHFKIACGAPIAQKKHISADTVLERLTLADVLVVQTLPGLGKCVLTKRTSEISTPELEGLIARTRSRLISEAILMDSIKEWLRRLALASYNSVKMRNNGTGVLPKVGTFAWDVTAPSYLSGLTNWDKGAKKPGLIVCDVLLNTEVHPLHIEPFLYKASSLQALKNVGRTMFIFVAGRYHKDAFQMLRTAGIIPATPESLFGKEIADAFRDLSVALTNAALGITDPVKFDTLFSKLSKLEGAVGNMRGAFFELLVAEVVRKTSPAQIQLNKICEGADGTAEVDVWVLKEGITARMIECKGMAPGATVDDEEIALWLTTRINRVRHYLFDVLNWKGPKPQFELWTSGLLSDVARERINKTRIANKEKYELVVCGPEELRIAAKAVNDLPLLKTLEHHFIPVM